MNIQELTANIDQKLAQLEQQISKLQKQSQQSDSNPEQIATDIAALQELKKKLIKSREIALRAHKLQREGDENIMRQKRWLGITLLIISVAGLLAIATAVFF